MRRSLALTAVLALTSCSSGPASPSPTPLNGTWRIVSIQLAPQPFPVFLPPELAYQLTFAESRVSARVDCNTCNGSFTNGSSLVIGPGLACTRAACGAYEATNSDVVTLLDGSHELSELRGLITLRSNRGTMILRPQ